MLIIGKARTVSGTGQNEAGTAIENKTYQRYKGIMGKASNELSLSSERSSRNFSGSGRYLR